MSEPKPVKVTGHFSVLSNDASHPTHINFLRFEDGSIGIDIVTKRDGQDEFVTAFRVGAKTFNMLSMGLDKAAHDEAVWFVPEAA